MNAYIHKAELWCEDCINQMKSNPDTTQRPTLPEGADLNDENTFDSDDYPKGPYPDGGGEADAPNHCDGCQCHLENPLTSDGADYVAKALLDRGGDPDVLDTWAEFYGGDLDLGNDELIDALKSAAWDAARIIDDEYVGVKDEEGEKMRNFARHLRRLQKL